MNFILKLIGGDKYTITEKQYQNILADNKQLIYLEQYQATFNRSTIANIFPEEKKEEIETTKRLDIGVLHDGTMVKRHFGNWVLINQEYPDDKGNSQPIMPDPTYYPEIAKDCVMTKDEYEKVGYLPSTEILKLNMQKRGRSEMSSLKSLLETKQIENGIE